jgi:hypothetical protein
MRPASQWLGISLSSLLIASLISMVDVDLSTTVQPLGEALAASEGPDLWVLRDVVVDAMTVLGTGLVVALGVVLAAGLLQGRTGPIRRRELQRLGIASSPRPAVFGLLVVGTLAVLVLLGALDEVAAGAARAADASNAGLALLFRTWGSRVAATVGGVTLIAGLVELALARRQIWRALHQSVEEHRRELRERG